MSRINPRLSDPVWLDQFYRNADKRRIKALRRLESFERQMADASLKRSGKSTTESVVTQRTNEGNKREF